MLERAREYLEKKGMAGRIIIPDEGSATVEDAARALGCRPAEIAKTLSFLQENGPVLILAEGTARIDNRKYKDCFGCKAKMIPPEEVERLVGHAVGGVCPFGVNEGVRICLDATLKKHHVVYPAAGSDHSAVRLTVKELEQVLEGAEWVDVCRDETVSAEK